MSSDDAVRRELSIALVKCGEDRMTLRSALATIEYWATDVPDDKLRERMELIRRDAAEMKNVGM